MATAETDQQHWQEIENVLTNVGMFLSTTLKKERLKKEAENQRLMLMTEVHSALTMLTKRHCHDNSGLYPIVTFQPLQNGSHTKKPPENHQTLPETGSLDGEDGEGAIDDNEDVYDEVNITNSVTGDQISLDKSKKQDEPLPELPEEESLVSLPVAWRRDYKNIYRALWDCTAEAANELGFKRGDFIHIISREYGGWWVGEKDTQVGLVPSQYLMEAYVKCS